MSNRKRNGRNVKKRQLNMSTSTRSMGRSKRSAQRRRAKQVGQVYLPVINQKPKQTRCIRYGNDETIPINLTFDTTDIRNMLGFTRGGTTDFYPLIDSFKLRRVGITLLPGDAVSGAGYFSFAWQGDNAPEVKETFLVGNTTPNHYSFSPPEGSTAWFWHDNQGSNEQLFSISNSQQYVYVIMDIELEYILNDGGVANQALTVNSTFTGVGARNIPITSGEFKAVELAAVN